jgi:dTDP-4-amino-4,6-dideoxygalactose transaminase
MSATKKMMGGMFGSEGFEYMEQPLPNFLKEPCLKLINGRSGIRILCDLLKPSKVWVPSYLCHSMTEAVPKKVAVEFYPINEKLQVKNLEWVKEVKAREIVVFIDYFGFDLHHKAMQAVNERKAWILQDAAQALLSKFERPYADYVLYSPRKTIGVPDGGILQSRCDEEFSGIVLEEAPAEFVLASNHVFMERTYFDRTGNGEWFPLYKKAEKVSPTGNYRMTELSLSLLQHGFDYRKIAKKRRENYQRLHRELEDIALLGELLDDVIPLGFPVVYDDRVALLKKLYAERIFCPVHWPIHGIVPESFKDAHRLASRIVTLLNDQRYDGLHVLRQAEHLKES